MQDHAAALLASEARAQAASGWGELKQATILFADVVGSTERIASLDPEQAMEHLQPAVRVMCAAIDRLGGTIVRTLGDGVMAIFGVPIALEGHALLACHAALGMQEDFRGNAHGLSIRVGLHSGLVASDPASVGLSWAQGAHGIAVHLASRVVALAEPGGVCLSEDCHALVRKWVRVESIGRRALKGIAQPVEILVLRSLLRSDDRLQATTGASSPFVGRERELAAIHEAYRRTQRGDVRVLGISGAPGTGKSRLCHEFVTHCRGLGVPVFEIRTQLYGQSTALQPVLELLRSYLLRLPAGCDAATARTCILERMSPLAAFSPADAALLNEFLGVAADDAPALPLAPTVRRARLLEIVSELVRLSGAHASVIVFEDLHWLDEGSEEFVMALVEAVASTRTFLVLNYRSMPRTPWEQVPHFEKVNVSELDETEIGELVRALLVRRHELHGITNLIAQRSAGNPFFAEELVRSLGDGNALPEGDVVALDNIEAFAQRLPATIQAVITARIDRLALTHKSVLQICSVIGKEVAVDILKPVADRVVEEIDNSLQLLCRLEFIQTQGPEADRLYSFRHPLIQEVAYGMQLKARRAPIHAAVAAAIEARYQDRLDELAGLVGYHYEAAGRFFDAASYVSRAARWVGSTNGGLAVKHWHKVRNLLGSHPRSREGDRLRAMASSQVAHLGWREGLTLEEVRPFIDEASQLAAEVDGRLSQLLLMVEGRMILASGGKSDDYVDKINQALALVPVGSDVGRTAMLSAALCQAYGRAGLIANALAANDVAWRGAASIDRFDREFMGFGMEPWILGMRGRSLARLGRFDEACGCWEQMLAGGTGAIDPTVQVIPCLGHVEFAWCNDDAHLATAQVRRLGEIASLHSVSYVDTVAHLCRGVAYTIAGDTTHAVPAFASALALVRHNKVATEFEPEILTGLAECHASNGEYERACELAQDAIRISRQRGTRVSELRALIVCAGAMARGALAGSADGARELFSQAQELIGITQAHIYGKPLAAARARLAIADAVSGPR